jgi:hypothetical protein
MAIVSRPSEAIAELLRESEELENAMERWQPAGEADRGEIDAVRRHYRDWMSRAKQEVSPADRSEFEKCYDAGTWSFRSDVKTFLANPLAESPLKDDEGGFPLGRWANPFDNVREPLEKQRSLLSDAMRSVGSIDQTVDELAAIFRRVGDYVRALPTEVTNERELQDVVEALLFALFTDVRREDPSSQVAGGASRVDFQLPEVGVIVELKMTRDGLTDNKVGQELLIDAGRYPKHPDCRAILAVVFDPERRLRNPGALERDLSQAAREGIPMRCVVAV